jgi:penicillin-binding protein-related factor A (putative recombinase)
MHSPSRLAMSGYANRGRIAELAVARQARIYLREGRAWLARQRVQQATGRDGRVVHVSAAPVDFIGASSGGRALALEVKQEAGESVALERFDDAQRGALGALHQLGAQVLVVFAFMAQPLEVYIVPWGACATFLGAPWRQSLSRAWCRANGVMAPAHCERGTLHRIAFLDAAPHVEQAAARDQVEAERAAALARPPREEQLELAAPIAPSPYKGLSADAIRDRLARACADGIDRQLRRQRRRRA